jgi:hypothetical protein
MPENPLKTTTNIIDNVITVRLSFPDKLFPVARQFKEDIVTTCL